MKLIVDEKPAFRKVPTLASAGHRKFDRQFPKRGGLACGHSNRGAGHDRVMTSAIRGGVSQHP